MKTTLPPPRRADRGRTVLPALAVALAWAAATAFAAPAPLPPARDPRIGELIDAVSAARIRADVETLVGFGTRHTMSETESDTRGIGAARRWIEAEFRRISAECGGCLEVFTQTSVVSGEPRIPEATEVVNVVAVLRGTVDPNRYVIMSGDVDSRVSDVMNATADSPGANDNASGMAGAIEAARVLSRHRFPASIVLAGLSGEEQGLYGGRHMAEVAKAEGWRIEAVINNDMIGNVAGVDGVIDNTSARVFSESPAAGTTAEELARMRFFGGEVDSPSRQLARYIDRVADEHFRQLDVMMVYRLDRFGRGGHHRPFNDAGFPAVRLMETHEHYDRQHQDLRVEEGREYGDVLEGVDFDYARKLTALNVATLASLAWAPPPPEAVEISGAVQPAATLHWQPPAGGPPPAGYKVYWRLTTSPTWDHWAWAGPDEREKTMDGLVIDNYYFGVAAVGADGHESPVVFPRPRR
ncbi:MAG TPA: M28 family metallopeptidase [Thermoanaerobaculia bacterium]|nr:M28 family metallopeptidase [Thermoanaerobaculia bacterium]